MLKTWILTVDAEDNAYSDLFATEAEVVEHLRLNFADHLPAGSEIQDILDEGGFCATWDLIEVPIAEADQLQKENETPVRAELVKHRDGVVNMAERSNQIDEDEGEVADEIKEYVLDLYHDIARSLGLLDTESSASRQHYIDTGAYPLHGEADETTPTPLAHPCATQKKENHR